MIASDRLPARSVIAHVDLDAFYAQVEAQRNPELRGKPVAVVQYNPFGDLRTITPDEDRIFNDSNGSLIAVSYEARGFGVKRNMRGDEARKACDALQLVQVPTAYGKADLTIYREGGARVIEILARGGICERASIDEAYLDVTEEATRRLAQCEGQLPIPINEEECFVYGPATKWTVREWLTSAENTLSEADALLACGAVIVAELRHAVRAELGYTCSAGIAHNKLLAKLCSGLHKPSKQTILPERSVQSLLDPLPLAKLRSLGGKLGQTVAQTLEVETVGQLAAVPLSRLEACFGQETGSWLYRMARGIHSEKVTQRKLPKSLGCSKTFRAQHVIRSVDDAGLWLLELAKEVANRIAVDQQQHQRMPRMLSLGISAGDSHVSRSCSLPSTTVDGLASAKVVTELFRRWAADQKGFAVTALGLSVFNFVAASSTSITQYFQRPGAVAQPSSPAGAASSIVAEGKAEGDGSEPSSDEGDDFGPGGAGWPTPGPAVGTAAVGADLPGDPRRPAAHGGDADDGNPPPCRGSGVDGGGPPEPRDGTAKPPGEFTERPSYYQRLTAAEVSAEVLAELPADIRRELLATLAPHKPPPTATREVDRKRARSSSKDASQGAGRDHSKRQPPISKFAVPRRLL